MLRMTVDRTLSLMGLALAVAWVIGMGVWLYPDVREEFEEKQYLARMAQEHPPMIPTECITARGLRTETSFAKTSTWIDAGLTCRPFGGSTRSLRPTRMSKPQPGIERRMGCRWRTGMARPGTSCSRVRR